MKLSMLQIAVVTAIARCMLTIKIELPFPSFISTFFSSINVASHNHPSSTAQNVSDEYNVDMARPLDTTRQPQQTKPNDDYYGQGTTMQEEAEKVTNALKRVASQVRQGAKEGTNRKNAYEVIFNSADLNFDGKMELKELALLLQVAGTKNMVMTKVKKSFRVMDNDRNGFVDMYEWKIAAPQLLPLKILGKKKVRRS